MMANIGFYVQQCANRTGTLLKARAIFCDCLRMAYPQPYVSMWDEVTSDDNESPTLSLTPGNPQVTRQFRGKADEYQPALVSLVGDVKLPNPLTGYFDRWNPLRDPTIQPIEAAFDGGANLDHRYYCTSVSSVKPQKWMGEVQDAIPDAPPTPPNASVDISNQWKYFVYTANYERLLYPIKPDSEIGTGFKWEYERNCYETEARLSTDYITLPGGVMQYRTPDNSQPNGRIIPFNVGRVFPLTEVNFVWARVPDEWFRPGTRLYERIYGTDRFFGALERKNRSYVGTVNSREFLGRSPGNLLLTGVTTERRISPLGRIEWNLTFNFAHDVNGHNWKAFYGTQLTDGPNGFYLVLRKDAPYPALPADSNLADGSSLFDINDFRELFWVADETIVPFPP
jgi:hypothetical protein